MKLLTDENIHREVAQMLRANGHDVLDIKAAGYQGLPDPEILRRAAHEKRVIITHDQDYLTLLRRALPRTTTIIILPADQPPRLIVARVQKLLADPAFLKKNFPCILVLEYNQLEIYPLS